MGIDRAKSETAPESALTEAPAQVQPPQEPSESAGTSSPEASKVAVKAVAGEEGHVKIAGYPEVDLTSGSAQVDADHAAALLTLSTVEAA